MHFIATIASIRPQDFLDIVFLSVVGYHLYIWFRRTKAFKALLGLVILGIVFTIARTWGLFLTTWVFQILWQVLIVLLIILFQPEIRQVLERVNPLAAMGWRRARKPAAWISPFGEGCFDLAGKKTGALILIERSDLADEWITDRIDIEADPTPALLASIFHKDSPMHDGAILIRDGRTIAVACYVPLSVTENLPQHWGTRHRAALGISERCDALVVVVSEERGEVAVATNGKMETVASAKALTEAITRELMLTTPKRSFKEHIRSLFSRRWREKLGAFALVSLCWLLLAGQQDFEVNFRLPVELRNMPVELELVDPVRSEVRLTARGMRKEASTLGSRNVIIKIDLAKAQVGENRISLSRNHIYLPNDRIDIIKIEPAEVAFLLRNATPKPLEPQPKKPQP
jgi:diadenylate cyclase